MPENQLVNIYHFNYIINTRAYLKIILHACKYPTRTVNGILLAQVSNEDDSSNQIIISDVVPLFHNWHTLTPMLEVGLQQIDIYANQNKLNVVGYYHANERIDDNKLPPFGQKIASKIFEKFNDAIALVVQNTKLSPEKPEIAIVPYLFKENQWRPDNKAFSQIRDSTFSCSFTLDNMESTDLVSSSIRNKHFEHLYDFDEHLENIELDWLNNTKVVELALEQDSKTQ
ncbi:12446_t:CDS:2 [Funneliformis geosporum]|nr:12446_t:CDS:2 [Funneliformis geosporum]